MKGRYAASLAVLVACRFAGPTSNPDQFVPFAGTDAGGPHVSTTTGDDATSTSPAGGAAGATPEDGGAAAGDDGGGLDAAFDDVPASGRCAPPVAVCDPVHNTGCNAFQQCDVDPLQTTTRTGQCVFGAGMDASVCTASIFTESCPPKSTCVDGGCRQICFCSADCPVGQCCSDTSGPPGFGLCRPCP